MTDNSLQLSLSAAPPSRVEPNSPWESTRTFHRPFVTAKYLPDAGVRSPKIDTDCTKSVVSSSVMQGGREMRLTDGSVLMKGHHARRSEHKMMRGQASG
jgi:hypothetical protein